jgi:hypothetical protein
MGTRAECEQVAAALLEQAEAAGIGAVLEVSAFYPNRPPSSLGRLYVDLAPPVAHAEVTR